MLESLETIAWNSYAQPEWNRLGTAPSALRSLANADTEQEAQAAYHRVLYATGNNHAGTYYPVVLAVVPFFAEILLCPRYWPRVRALDVLIELASFWPEPGYELITLQGGEVHEVRRLLHNSLTQVWRPLEARFLTAEDAHERDLARQLTEALDEPE